MKQQTPFEAAREAARTARIQENLNLISRYKTDINMVTFLLDIGFVHDKKHTTRNTPVMDQPSTGRTLIIHRNPKSNEYVYHNPKDSDDKGNIIKLAAQHYQLDLSNKDGWNELHKRLGEMIGNVYFTKHEVVIPLTQTVKDVQDQGPAAVASYFKLQPLTNTDYLVKERKISEAVVRAPEFEGKILNRPFNDKRTQTSGLNTVFPIENERGMIGVMNRNTEWNQIVGTKENGIWVSNLNPDIKPKEFVITESPINSLSYHELHPPQNPFDRVYISTAGNPSQTQHLTIQRLINTYKPEKLTMANDNDPSGIRFNVNMMSRLTMPDQPRTSFTMQINSSQNTNTLVVEFDPRQTIQTNNLTAEQVKDRINQVLNRGFEGDAPKARISVVSERPDFVQIRADFSHMRTLLVRSENLVKEFKQTGQHIEIKRSIENDFNDDLKVKAAKIASIVIDPRQEMLRKLGPSPKGTPILGTQNSTAPAGKSLHKAIERIGTENKKPGSDLPSQTEKPKPTPKIKLT